VIDAAGTRAPGRSRELDRQGACAWFEEAQTRRPFRVKHFVLGAPASLLRELEVTDLACDDLAPIRLWLAQYTHDGGEPGESSSSLYRECVATQRCLFHKYTSRGGLTLAKGKEYVGVDRFLGDATQFRAALQEVHR
jgi:hypothetical protein